MENEAAPIAVALSRALKQPVQVILSHSSTQNHDPVAPGALARMTALPGEGGITAAWAMRVATADGLGSALARLKGRTAPDKLDKAALDGAVPPYSIPNVRIEAVDAKLPFVAGYMRGSPNAAAISLRAGLPGATVVYLVAAETAKRRLMPALMQ